ncbi:MAG: hypothetical protein RLZZ493_1412 [Bacteroidota bacterium]|jgi:hypothetical protein
MKVIVLFVSIFFLFANSAQAQLSGVLVYQVDLLSADTMNPQNHWQVVVYTNDTMVRVETQGGPFGKQVYIRHMVLNKAYLLLAMDGQKFAIRTDLANKSKDTSLNYTVKKLVGSKKINGIRCKKYKITDVGAPMGYVCYFAKKIPNKYIEVYQDIPGLALDYFLPSQNGLIHYQLVQYEAQVLDKNMFGIPSDYKKVTFEEFMSSLNNN